MFYFNISSYIESTYTVPVPPWCYSEGHAAFTSELTNDMYHFNKEVRKLLSSLRNTNSPERLMENFSLLGRYLSLLPEQRSVLFVAVQPQCRVHN